MDEYVLSVNDPRITYMTPDTPTCSTAFDPHTLPSTLSSRSSARICQFPLAIPKLLLRYTRTSYPDSLLLTNRMSNKRKASSEEPPSPLRAKTPEASPAPTQAQPWTPSPAVYIAAATSLPGLLVQDSTEIEATVNELQRKYAIEVANIRTASLDLPRSLRNKSRLTHAQDSLTNQSFVATTMDLAAASETYRDMLADNLTRTAHVYKKAIKEPRTHPYSRPHEMLNLCQGLRTKRSKATFLLKGVLGLIERDSENGGSPSSEVCEKVGSKMNSALKLLKEVNAELRSQIFDRAGLSE